MRLVPLPIDTGSDFLTHVPCLTTFYLTPICTIRAGAYGSVQWAGWIDWVWVSGAMGVIVIRDTWNAVYAHYSILSCP
jgi:hypothetical protein